MRAVSSTTGMASSCLVILFRWAVEAERPPKCLVPKAQAEGGGLCPPRLPGGHLTHGVDLNLLIAVEFAEPAVVPIHRLHCADLILGQAVGYEPITANCHTLQRNWHMLLTNPKEAARADHEVLLAVRPHN